LGEEMMFKAFVLGLVLGLVLGIAGHGLYLEAEYTTFNKPKYELGDCLSNGLYFEKVTEIRKSKVFGMNPMYVTDTYFADGHRGPPSTTDTWIADKDYVQVNWTNCVVRK
jgi:hypothetical protein